MNKDNNVKSNKEILEMFIYNFKEFEEKYKQLTRYVQHIQNKKEQLEKENQELKEQINSHIDSELIVNKLIAKQDQFLKVVESVLNNHIHMNDKCSCFWESETDTFGEHLLQEIRKAMENGE